MSKELFEKCPQCDGYGWYTETVARKNGEPEPEQAQCYVCPESCGYIPYEGAAQKPQVDGWLPISSAPRKKKWVILACFPLASDDGDTFPEVMSGFYDIELEEWCNYEDAIPFIPTHYMPLPQPPSAASREGK